MVGDAPTSRAADFVVASYQVRSIPDLLGTLRQLYVVELLHNSGCHEAANWVSQMIPSDFAGSGSWRTKLCEFCQSKGVMTSKEVLVIMSDPAREMELGLAEAQIRQGESMLN